MAAGLLLAALFALYWAVLSQLKTGEQLPAISAVQETNTFFAETTTAPGTLDRNLTAEEIRKRISSAAWQTLWVEGELITQSQDQMPRQQKHQYVQAWFSREGVQRVIATRQQDYAPAGSSANYGMAHAWLSDGETLSIFDTKSDPVLTNVPVELLSVRPEIYQPVVLMIDGHITSYRSDLPEPVQQDYADGMGNLIETIAGREAVVVDWGFERLWVDTQTGILLRWQRYEDQPGSSEIVLDMTIRSILIDPPLPENLLDRDGLPDLQFEFPPDQNQAEGTKIQSYEQAGFTVEMYAVGQPGAHLMSADDLDAGRRPESLAVLARRQDWRTPGRTFWNSPMPSIDLDDLFRRYGYHLEGSDLYHYETLIAKRVTIRQAWTAPDVENFGMVIEESVLPGSIFHVLSQNDHMIVRHDPQGSVHVERDGQLIFEQSRPKGSVLGLIGLWSYEGQWIMEMDGSIIVDGQSLNEVHGYEQSFGWRLLSGKPFFFFIRDGKVGLSYNGDVLGIYFDEVPHNLCCSAAAMNVLGNETMVWFYARVGDQWHYVEAGAFDEG